MSNMQRSAILVALVLGGMLTFSGAAHAQASTITIKGTVYQPNGMVQKNPRVLVSAYDSNNVLINFTLSNATSGVFTLSDTHTFPDPLDLRIKLTFKRETDSNISRTMTILLGPSTTTVIDVTCPPAP